MDNNRVVAIVGVVVALGLAFWWASPSHDASPAVRAAPQSPGAASTDVVAFAVFPTIEDRFVSEPCSRIPGGGLFSLHSALADVTQASPGTIGVSLGDLTLAEGGIGRAVATFHYNDVFPQTGIRFVAAGEGELGFGVDYVRSVLTRSGTIDFICANAVDANGLGIMRRWALAKCGSRGAVIVAVAADSLQAEIERRGSDVRLSPAQKAVEDAKAEGLAQAARTGFDVDVFALFVHGTVEEASAIVEKTPGVTFAVAAHGPVLPASAPVRVGSTPIYYAGRGMRFGWAIWAPPDDRPLDAASLRVGGRLLGKGSPYGDLLRFFRDASTQKIYDDVEATPGERLQDARGAYVGASRCGDCHIQIAAEFAASAHAKRSRTILESPFAGNTGCVNCHQTGPYARGGWKGPKDKTSDLAAVSCEACHGPGERHAAMPKTARMPKVGLSRCYDCHLPDRSVDFDAEAAWKRHGHKLVR